MESGKYKGVVDICKKFMKTSKLSQKILEGSCTRHGDTMNLFCLMNNYHSASQEIPRPL